MSARRKGFTLLEVLVALVIFALVALALYSRVGDVVRQTGHLTDRTIAGWVADNRMTELLTLEKIPGEPLLAGSRADFVNLGNREWRLTTSIETTDNPLVQRVEIRVFRDDGSDVALATLAGFAGVH